MLAHLKIKKEMLAHLKILGYVRANMQIVHRLLMFLLCASYLYKSTQLWDPVPLAIFVKHNRHITYLDLAG